MIGPGRADVINAIAVARKPNRTTANERQYILQTAKGNLPHTFYIYSYAILIHLHTSYGLLLER